VKNYTHENILLGTLNPPREGLLCDAKSSSPHGRTTFGDNNIYVGTNGLHEIRGQVCIMILWTGRCYFSVCAYVWVSVPIPFPGLSSFRPDDDAQEPRVSSSLVTAFVLMIIFCVLSIWPFIYYYVGTRPQRHPNNNYNMYNRGLNEQQK